MANSKVKLNGPKGSRVLLQGSWEPHSQANGATRELQIGELKGTMIRWGNELSLKIGSHTHGPFKFTYQVHSLMLKLEAEL